jgi:hypothetical protein
MRLALHAAQAGISTSYDHTNHWLYADWYDEHNQETSRQACVLLLAQLRLHPTIKILNDNCRIVHTSVEMSEWGAW